MVANKELRIGNSVNYIQVVSEEKMLVEEVILLPGMIVHAAEFPQLYSPIILTNEILERYQFTPIGGTFYERTFKPQPGIEIKITISINLRFLFVGDSRVVFNSSLHHLQNLWYWLTGEEMEAKV